MPFFADGVEGTSRLGSPNPDLPPPKELPRLITLVTLDQFCAERGLIPNWLLIDVEGYEIKALAGASQLIRANRGRLGLVVELHPNLWASAGSNVEQLQTWLHEQGLTVRPLLGQRSPFAEHGLVSLEPAAS
jgi:hypothetical protein